MRWIFEEVVLPVITAIGMRSSFGRRSSFVQRFFVRSNNPNWFMTLSTGTSILSNSWELRFPVPVGITACYTPTTSWDIIRGDGFCRWRYNGTAETKTKLLEEKLHESRNTLSLFDELMFVYICVVCMYRCKREVT